MVNTYNLIHSARSVKLIKKGCKTPRRTSPEFDMYIRSYIFQLLLKENCIIYIHNPDGSVNRRITNVYENKTNET